MIAKRKLEYFQDILHTPISKGNVAILTLDGNKSDIVSERQRSLETRSSKHVSNTFFLWKSEFLHLFYKFCWFFYIFWTRSLRWFLFPDVIFWFSFLCSKQQLRHKVKKTEDKFKSKKTAKKKLVTDIF